MRASGAAFALFAGVAGGCRGPDFSQQAIDRAVVGAGLPASFKLGIGTSAYQIEGGNQSDWADWEQGAFPDGTPHMAGGVPSGRADGSWTLWPQDVVALDYLGANAYRLGLEWSRLQPEEDRWDETAFAHYRDELEALRAHGIAPLVTVHHLTLPRWVAAKGGWEWPGIVSALAALGERLGAAYGDLVDDWVTVNEPNAIFTASYAIGRWPPGVSDAARGLQVYARTLEAHAAIARALRRADLVAADGPGHPATFIGLAHDMVLLQPATSSPLDTVLTGYGDALMNEAVPDAVRSGVIDLNIPGLAPVLRQSPDLLGTFDYLGLNYYRRTDVRLDDLGGFGVRSSTPAGAPQSELGWEIYAQGFYEMLRRCAGYGWPIMITENGVADATDALRPGYLRAHVYAMQLAMQAGVDVRGYYFWTLADNYELTSGYTQKLGLFTVDPGDPALRRVPKGSAETFRDIARAMGRTPKDALP